MQFKKKTDRLADWQESSFQTAEVCIFWLAGNPTGAWLSHQAPMGLSPNCIVQLHPCIKRAGQLNLKYPGLVVRRAWLQLYLVIRLLIHAQILLPLVQVGLSWQLGSCLAEALPSNELPAPTSPRLQRWLGGFIPGITPLARAMPCIVGGHLLSFQLVCYW